MCTSLEINDYIIFADHDTDILIFVLIISVSLNV
jgi:hypothetical protein